MHTPTGLIQIVSEEAMPSLLPVLAFKPNWVIHIVTSSFEHQSRQIMRAADSVGAAPPPNCYEEIVFKDMPSMAEIHQAVTNAIKACQQKHLQPVLNFTGGTKLMSIGAFQAAQKEGVTSFYVDGEHRRFLDGASGPAVGDFLKTGLSLDPLAAQLSVQMILVAHGCEWQSRSQKVNAPLVALARHLLLNPVEEEAAFRAMAGKGGALAKFKAIRSAAGWRDAEKVKFDLPEPLAKVAEAAEMIIRDGSQARLRGCPHSKKEHGLCLQKQYQFFEGTWWELAVAEAIRQCGAFVDVQSNISIAKGGKSPLEEDVLAVQGLQLAYFSCKRGNAGKLHRHLEEVEASARRLGGKFARKYLAVCHLPGDMRGDLQKRAAQLHIKILEPCDLKDDASLLQAANPL
jgi:hypothetical protein